MRIATAKIQHFLQICKIMCNFTEKAHKLHYAVRQSRQRREPIRSSAQPAGLRLATALSVLRTPALRFTSPKYVAKSYGLCQTDRGRGEHPATSADLRGPRRHSVRFAHPPYASPLPIPCASLAYPLLNGCHLTERKDKHTMLPQNKDQNHKQTLRIIRDNTA